MVWLAVMIGLLGIIGMIEFLDWRGAQSIRHQRSRKRRSRDSLWSRAKPSSPDTNVGESPGVGPSARFRSRQCPAELHLRAANQQSVCCAHERCCAV